MEQKLTLALPVNRAGGLALLDFFLFCSHSMAQENVCRRYTRISATCFSCGGCSLQKAFDSFPERSFRP